MGDKTQLLVMGFAAKYKISDIIFGVGLATMLLNFLGVFMGRIISQIIPMHYINLAAGFFFLIFAILTIGDNGNEEQTKCQKGTFWAIGSAFFLAELGDKTQLSAIAFSASSPDMTLGVFLGATLGMIVADGIGLIAAHLLGKKIPAKLMNSAAYVIFTVFGIHTLWRCLSNAKALVFIILSVYFLISLVLLFRGNIKHQRA